MSLSIEEQVVAELRRIIRATQLNAKTLATSSQLTVSQLLVLQLLKSAGEMTPRQISQHVNLTQATVTTLLDRLEERQLISRRRSEADKRSVHVGLTELGTAQLVQAPRTLQDRFLMHFNQLQDWEQMQLLSSLQRIAQMMDAASLDASPVLDVGSLDRGVP